MMPRTMRLDRDLEGERRVRVVAREGEVVEDALGIGLEEPLQVVEFF
jgi:hypothetical protein